MCLRSTSTDCKQRTSTASTKAPTVSKKASPFAPQRLGGMKYGSARVRRSLQPQQHKDRKAHQGKKLTNQEWALASFNGRHNPESGGHWSGGHTRLPSFDTHKVLQTGLAEPRSGTLGELLKFWGKKKRMTMTKFPSRKTCYTNSLFRFSSLHSIVRSKVRRWEFILSSTAPDPLKTAILKGLQTRSGP